MAKRFLYELPGIAFDVLLKHIDSSILESLIDFTIEWANGEITNARIIILESSIYEKPSLVFTTFKSKESRLILLKNPPKLPMSKSIFDYDLDVYSTLEAGRMEGLPDEDQDEEQGYSIKLYLEFRTTNNGLYDLTDPKERLTSKQSSSLEKLGRNLYWSSKYLWYKELFENVDGDITPVRNAIVI